MSIRPSRTFEAQSSDRPTELACWIYLSYACCCTFNSFDTCESSDARASLRFDQFLYVLDAVLSTRSIFRLIRSNSVSIQSRVSFVSSALDDVSELVFEVLVLLFDGEELYDDEAEELKEDPV